jgi:hypothetical protein
VLDSSLYNLGSFWCSSSCSGSGQGFSGGRVSGLVLSYDYYVFFGELMLFRRVGDRWSVLFVFCDVRSVLGVDSYVWVVRCGVVSFCLWVSEEGFYCSVSFGLLRLVCGVSWCADACVVGIMSLLFLFLGRPVCVL